MLVLPLFSDDGAIQAERLGSRVLGCHAATYDMWLCVCMCVCVCVCVCDLSVWARALIPTKMAFCVHIAEVTFARTHAVLCRERERETER